jgi:hypothetical protein
MTVEIHECEVIKKSITEAIAGNEQALQFIKKLIRNEVKEQLIDYQKIREMTFQNLKDKRK